MKWYTVAVALVSVGILLKVFIPWSSKVKNSHSTNEVGQEKTFSNKKPVSDKNKFHGLRKIEKKISHSSHEKVVEHQVEDIQKEPDDFYLTPYLNKTYKWTDYDSKFDDLLISIGVTEYWRRAVVKISSYAEELVKEEGGVYDLVRYGGRSKYDTRFKLDTEVAYETLDGRSIKATFSVNKNVLKEVQKWMVKDKERTATIEREYNGNKLKVTIQVDGITCVTKYDLT